MAGGKDVDLLRLVVLALDSDLPADPAPFLAAANTASLLTDMDLTERLVGAARGAGAGFDAQLQVARGWDGTCDPACTWT
jgi:hypothetical protein